MSVSQKERKLKMNSNGATNKAPIHAQETLSCVKRGDLRSSEFRTTTKRDPRRGGGDLRSLDKHIIRCVYVCMCMYVDMRVVCQNTYKYICKCKKLLLLEGEFYEKTQL